MRRSRPGTPAVSWIIVTFLVGGCGVLAGTPSAPTSIPTGTPVPTSSPAPTSTPAPPDRSPVATSTSGGATVVDSGLIAHLPTAVAGIVIRGDPDTAAGIATDPDLAASASAIAVALAVGPDDPAGTDLAVVSLVQLRPGVFTDGFFRSWRDTYDAAACDAAGGTAGNAQAVIDGRDVFIGTCAGGAHTYHVHLDGPDVIVSVTSVGAGRLGELIVGDLRE